MNRFGLWKRTARVGLILLLVLAMLPTVGIAQNNNLSLDGTRSVDKSDLYINEGFTLTYCINPIGSYTQRDKLDISLVLDVSGSMDYTISNDSRTKRIDALKRASKLLIDQIKASNYGDRLGIVKFSTSASNVQALTTNYNQVTNQINALRPDGWTNINHGLTLGQTMLRNSPNKEYIVLLTDGAATHYYNGRSHIQNASGARNAILDDNIPKLQEAGIPVLAIALAASGSDVDIPLLRTLAADTGGQFFQATNEAELNEVFDSLLGIMEPNINQIRVEQEFPAGFKLLDDAPKNMKMENNVLTIELEDIPYNYDKNYDCQVPVPLVYTGPVGTHTLKEANVHFRVGDEPRSIVIDDPIVLEFTDLLIGLQGQVRTKQELSEEQKASWNLKDALPIQYTIQPTGELIQSGTITDAKLVHLLPAGVFSTGASPSQEEVIHPETGEKRVRLTYSLDDVKYDRSTFTPNQIVKEASLRFDYADLFDLGSTDESELWLEFTNNRGEEQRVPLTNHLPSIEAKVILEDQWSNKYVGDRTGTVTRYGSSGTKHWSYKHTSTNVKDLSFVAGSDEAAIKAIFRDDAEQVLDQRPTVPTVVIQDRKDQVIVETDQSYKQGAGKLTASNSRPSLPETAVIESPLFKEEFIDHYQYRTAGGEWGSLGTNNTATLSNSGANQSFEVRAVTRMIAGIDKDVVHAGSAKERIVSLDAIAPVIPGVISEFTDTYGTYRHQIEGSFSDEHSGLEKDADGKEFFTLIKDTDQQKRPIGDPNSMIFNSTAEQIAAGKVIIRARDQVGNEATRVVGPPTDETAPDITWDITPNPTDDPTITITATETESFVRSIKVWFNGKPLTSEPDKSTPGDQTGKSVVLQFKLSDVYPDNASLDNPKEVRYGSHQMVIEAENFSGVKGKKEHVFLVNPGPQFTLETEPIDFVANPGTYANKPVTVSVIPLFEVLKNSNRYGGTEVRLKEMHYAIVDSIENKEPANNEWKKLGSTQLTVSTEGTNNIVWVYIQLTDSQDISTTQFVPVRINYNQNRY